MALVFLITSCNKSKTIDGISKYENISSVSDFASELWIKGNTFKVSFSDDYRTFYFFRKVAPDIEKYVPYKSKYINGKWEEPQIMAFFDKKNSYTYQLKVPNSDKLIFISNKKTKKDTTQNPNYNFWQTTLEKDKHSKPEEIEYKNLIYNYNSQPCITNNGTIFFSSDLPDWSETLSYKMSLINNEYSEPELFGPVNNWRRNEDWKVFEFCVSPKEDYMIICIQDISVSDLSTDLYISYFDNDYWTHPEKLNSEINSSETENFPSLTNDGKYLIFTRAFSEFKIIPTKFFESKQ